MYDVNDLSRYPYFKKQLETFGAVALHDALLEEHRRLSQNKT